MNQSDYGDSKSLTEILEELVIYCAKNGCLKPTIAIKLPKKVMDAYSQSLEPFIGEKIENCPPVQLSPLIIGEPYDVAVKRMWYSSGTVEFLKPDDT